MSKSERHPLTDYVGKPCAYCGNPMAGESFHPTRDHAIPKSLGGTLAKWNCVICCFACNNEKDHKTLEEYWLACCDWPDNYGEPDLLEALIRERFSIDGFRMHGLRMRGARATRVRRARMDVWARLGLSSSTAGDVAIREQAEA